MRTFKPWQPQEETNLMMEYGERMTADDIAQLHQRSLASVERKIHGLQTAGKIAKRLARNGARLDSLDIAYTSPIIVRGDCMVVSDTHLPYWDKPTFGKIIAIANKFLPKGKRQLILAGDFISLDAFGKYVSGTGFTETEKEFNAATKLLELLLDTFDYVVWLSGNHERRLWKHLGGNVRAETFLRMITTGEIEKRVKITGYPYVLLDKGNWRISHPSNFSAAGGTVPVKLADRHQCNVLGAHSHSWGMQTSASGFLGIDGGCTCDDTKMAYYALGEGTSRAWQKGFTLFLSGHAYPFSMRHSDFNFWLNKIRIGGK